MVQVLRHQLPVGLPSPPDGAGLPELVERVRALV
jgi:hypothetical protein